MLITVSWQTKLTGHENATYDALSHSLSYSKAAKSWQVLKLKGAVQKQCTGVIPGRDPRADFAACRQADLSKFVTKEDTTMPVEM